MWYIPIESGHASEILSQVKLTHKSYTPPPEFKNEAWSSNSRCHSLEAYRGDRSRWLQEVELDVSLITMPWAFKTRTWKVILQLSSKKNFTQNFIAMRLSSASTVVVRWKYLLLTRLRVGMDLIHTQLASYLDAQRGHDQVVPLLPWLGLVLLEMLALPWFECLVGMYWQKIFCPYIQ